MGVGLPENWVAYVAIAVCVLPLLYLARKWVAPILLYALEFVAYVVSMHGVIWCLLRAAGWFKANTAMNALDLERVNPGWNSPWWGFWERERYNPQWVFYAEVVSLFLIAYLMYQFRPMSVQQRFAKRANLTKGMSSSAASTYDADRKLREMKDKLK